MRHLEEGCGTRLCGRFRALAVVTLAAAAAGSLDAQLAAPLLPGGSVLPQFSLCDRNALAANPSLSFAQRSCYFGIQLLSPSTMLRAGFVSGWGQWLNAPYLHKEDADDLGHRFAAYYARRSARSAGELLAGYLDHEDPRYHLSGEAGIRGRTRSALVSVLLTRNADGDSRLALAPLAGSLSAGFAGMACYRQHSTVAYAFRGAAATYGSYFATAVYREFRPDLRLRVQQLVEKIRPVH